jgi:hypothetical protein
VEAYYQWDDVAVHSTAKWTKLLLYASSYFIVYVSDGHFPLDYYGDTFFQSAGTTYVTLPSFIDEIAESLPLSLDPYSIQTILGGVSVIGTIPALVSQTPVP